MADGELGQGGEPYYIFCDLLHRTICGIDLPWDRAVCGPPIGQKLFDPYPTVIDLDERSVARGIEPLQNPIDPARQTHDHPAFYH